MAGTALEATIMQVDATPTFPRSKKTATLLCSTSEPRKASMGMSGGAFQMNVQKSTSSWASGGSRGTSCFSIMLVLGAVVVGRRLVQGLGSVSRLWRTETMGLANSDQRPSKPPSPPVEVRRWCRPHCLCL